MGCPALTLMAVANPWMLLSPAPTMSHSEGGLPGFEFSQAIGFTTGLQGWAAVAAGAVNGSKDATIATSKGTKKPLNSRCGRVAEGPVIRTPGVVRQLRIWVRV